ncbi:MAG: 16S rRNA (guanine(966)-N(2))-methyltransferase RsmD [Arcobacteraceae bacterium]|jgi:16S rRNA (guanine(966)-N(2))-methyltransferase RsmD|nr:16S rRNA (guanine(966)-N(2))-methyltransferase RsmD [Arcobacteraceae bacterium]
MSNKLITKIIAGKYKGKSVELPALETTRSSKAILKESFFNVLQYDVIDTIFIEAFGGSGSIGLEALSRGAKHSYFCEIDKKSYKILERNCKTIDADNSTPILGDTFEVLPRLVNNSFKNDAIIVYIDPPFDFRDGMENIYQKSYEMVESFTNENIFLITFEHKAELVLPDILGSFRKYKTKKFGNSSLSYFERFESEE